MQFMRLIIYMLSGLLCLTIVTTQSSTKERIERHKAWLERRESLKALYNSNNNTNDKLTYFQQIFNLNNEINISPKKERNYEDILKKYKKYYKSSMNEVLSVEEMRTSTMIPLVGSPEKSNISNAIDESKLTTTVAPLLAPTIRTPTTNGATVFSNITVISTTPKPVTEASKSNITEKLPRRRGHRNKIRKPILNRRINKLNRNTTRILNVENQIGIAKWGEWNTWTSCSRSCGGGVMSQFRNCYRTISTNSTTNNESISGHETISEDCIGIYKRYRLCNEQNCSNSNVDFRAQQCTAFNSQPFRGRHYVWEAYIAENSECELNCIPIGMKYFATLSEKVIDGTACYHPQDYLKRSHLTTERAICVEGVCKAVHSSGVISGAYMNNGAVRCGAIICRPITGVFNKNPLPREYVHVATIPAGASNITITELKNSINFLVLKDTDRNFIINGDYTASPSGVHEAAGTIFDYRRIDGLTNTSSQPLRKNDGVTEWITAIGPILEPIFLMMLSNEDNLGIKYEYLLPLSVNGPLTTSQEDNSIELSNESDTALELTTLPTTPTVPRHTLKSGPDSGTLIEKTPIQRPPFVKRKYIWQMHKNSPCSKSCGGGVIIPVFRCLKEASGKYAREKRCAHLPKPSFNEAVLKCNTQPCPAYWNPAPWTDCKCGTADEEVYQYRDISCIQEIAPNRTMHVNALSCLEETPHARQLCDCPKRTRVRHNRFGGQNDGPSLGKYHHSHHNHYHRGQGNRLVTIIGSNSINKRNHHVVEVNKNSGIWLSSDWNQQCSSDCGDGIQYRSIFCDRSSPNTDRCDLRMTPDTTRQCITTNKCSVGDWFTGTWGQCSGDCFNLTKTRQIYCIKDGAIVNDRECNGEEKPITIQSCPVTEVPDCKPRWYYSEWTDCTKECGSGNHRRTVKCFEPIVAEKQLRESQNCRYSERQPAYQSCNTHSCDSTTTTKSPDPRVDMIQNDGECINQYAECDQYFEKGLCGYEHIYRLCCQSCQRLYSHK